MPTPTPQCQRQAGFTLLEALIALLVMSFGMLAIAAFQSTLSSNSDLAKQRSEAVRLAQQKMEELRSFSQLTASGTAIDYTDLTSNSTGDIVTANGSWLSNTYYSNTAYTRTWGITSNGSTATTSYDLQKWIRVSVSWTDRAGASQSVTLTSAVSRSDPVNLKLWTTNSGSTTTRRPKNRNIDIPYPATDFGNGTSGFAPGGASGIYYIFNNTTGEVTYACLGTSVVQYSSNTSGCTATTGYVLSGYIFWYTGSSAPSASDFTVTLTNNNNNLQDPPPLNYTDVDSYGRTNMVGVQFTSPTTTAGKTCFVQKQMATSSTHTIDVYNASTQHDYAFATYLCVVTPIIVSSISATEKRWYGMFTITLDGSHTLGTGSSNYKLCRFTGDYDADDVISNTEHPLYYRGVTATLDNQNYVLIPSDRTCPTDTEVNTSSGKYTNNNTETHQTQAVSGGTIPYGGSRSTSSQFAATNGTESSDTTVELPME